MQCTFEENHSEKPAHHHNMCIDYGSIDYDGVCSLLGIWYGVMNTEFMLSVCTWDVIMCITLHAYIYIGYASNHKCSCNSFQNPPI